jgi:hypothetical protein
MPAHTPGLGLPYPLPEDALVDYPALGQELAEALDSGGLIASGRRTNNVVHDGASFAAGYDILPTPLDFVADGVSDYLIEVSSRVWMNNNSPTSTDVLNVSLDGADAGMIAQGAFVAPNIGSYLYARGVLVQPPAGAHAVNVRLWVTGTGVATIVGGVGGPDVDTPLLVTLRRL